MPFTHPSTSRQSANEMKLSIVSHCSATSKSRVSILVNLNGYAGTAKSADIFARRPASVAVSYMGFPGTMGSSELVDYILADGVVIPLELRQYYTEKVHVGKQGFFPPSFAVLIVPAVNWFASWW